MNKKFFLSVFLLGALTLSSGVLTSCIDNDEPEGITTLRGAKAELLRAKAALELAQAESEKQRALLIAAKAEVQKAEAEIKKAEAEIKKAEAAIKLAQAAYKEAETAEQQAKADSAKALAEKQKAEAEADIARIKAQLEVDLVNLQKSLANAQQLYNNTLAEIEAAKAVLTSNQASKLEELKLDVNTAWADLKGKQTAVLTAMNSVFNSTNNHADSLQLLQNQVIDAKAKLIAVNAAHDELTKLANSVSITAWEARRDSIEAYVGIKSSSSLDSIAGTASVDSITLEIKKLEIEQSAEYKAKEEEDFLARQEYVFAQMNYNYLANDTVSQIDCFENTGDHINQKDYSNAKYGYKESGTHPTTSARNEAKRYAFDGVTIPVTNQWILDNIINPEAFAEVEGDSCIKIDGYKVEDDNAPFYQDWNQNEQNRGFSTAFNANCDSFDISLKITAWKKAINDLKITEEMLAADTCKQTYKKALEDTQKAHNDSVEAWKKAHKVYTEGKVEQTVSTTDFKAAITKYNDNIVALKAAVTDYNTAFKNAKTDLYNKNIEEAKIENAIAAIEDSIDNYCPDITSIGTRRALSQIDALIGSSTANSEAQGKAKTAYRTAITVAWTALPANQIALKEAAAVPNNTTVEAEASVENALKVIKNAEGTGLVDILAKSETDPEKLINGSYKSIEYALTAFQDSANANCEKLKPALATKLADIPGYTGVSSTPTIVNASDGTKAPVTATDYYMNVWEKDGNVWKNTGLKQVVRTIVSDDNVTKMATVEFDATQAKENWIRLSRNTFGTGNDADSARHTELTADMVKETTSGASTTYIDENNKELTNYTNSTLYALDDAKKKVAYHEAVADAADDLAAVLEAVETYEAAVKATIAEYQESIDEAYAAIEPAKKAHQAAHQAAAQLLVDIDAQITAIGNKKAELAAIKDQLDNIIKAYYSNQEFSYVDENDSIVSKPAVDVESLKKWINDELKKYEKKDPNFPTPLNDTPYENYYTQSQGKIKDAEYIVSYYQNALDRFIADGEFDGVALDQLKLEQAQQELAVAQKYYDFALAQLQAYLAALGLE